METKSIATLDYERGFQFYEKYKGFLLLYEAGDKWHISWPSESVRFSPIRDFFETPRDGSNGYGFRTKANALTTLGLAVRKYREFLQSLLDDKYD